MESNALIPELAVADLAASLEFYIATLGFKLEYERPEERFAFLSRGAAQLMLDQIDKGRTFQTASFEPPLGRGCNLQITVRPETLDTMLDSLRDSALPLFLAPEEKWYAQGSLEHGQRQFAVADPDGYLLRFACELGSREKTS